MTFEDLRDLDPGTIIGLAGTNIRDYIKLANPDGLAELLHMWVSLQTGELIHASHLSDTTLTKPCN